MTVDATYIAPAADPLHAVLDAALTPYLGGDLDATSGLIEALLEVIATAEHTPELVATLHATILALPQAPELVPAIYNAVGAAYEFTAPAPATSQGHGTQAPAPRPARGTGPREGSLGEAILTTMAEQPGTAMKIGDLCKHLGGPSRAGALGAAMDRLIASGLTVKVADSPKRYLRTDDPDAPAQDTTPGQPAPVPTEAPASAPAKAPATEQATEAPAPAPKAPARRAAAKTGK